MSLFERHPRPWKVCPMHGAAGDFLYAELKDANGESFDLYQTPDYESVDNLPPEDLEQIVRAINAYKEPGN